MTRGGAPSPVVGPWRKRKCFEDTDESAHDSTQSTSPSEDSQRSDHVEKRRRVIGPTLPPGREGSLAEKAQKGDDTSSSSDDDMGPALPTSTDEAVREPAFARC